MVHIKYLRLRGFKSVGATRTVQIDFDKGFSAIVGANGSGKSNILEAFSFVMGNGSAKSLRGENMASLIFSGNKKKGIPPAKEAHVELVFDNSDRGLPLDADVVSISRTVNRAGKGTYKLNGKNTTRTAIKDLLAMAGLDSNSYNMVLQGNVYEVVNMTKTERRQLIEEVAGIAAYDEKKAQAERELEKTETDLAQIRLLMNEVSTQLADLEKERDDALRYQELVRHLDRSSNALKILEIRGIEADIAATRNKVAALQDKINEISKELDAKERERADAIGKIKSLNEDLAKKEGSELLSLNRALENAKQEISGLRSELKYLKGDREKALKDREQLLNRAASLRQEKERLVGITCRLREEIGGLETCIASKQGELESIVARLAANDEEYQALVEKRERLLSVRADARQELAEKKSDLKIVSSKLQASRAEIDRLEKELAERQALRERTRKELDDIRKALARQAGDVGSMDDPATIQSRIKRLESELRVNKEMIRKKSEEIFELRSNIKARKKYSTGSNQQAIKALLEARDKGEIDGIFDTISHLGKVDPKYAVAMEIAAGSRLNFMVVRDREVASRCIRFLKERRLGRLSFIPLDKIRYSEPDRGEKLEKGVHGRAVDLIDFERIYLPAFEYIFGRTYIVEDLETAKRVKQGFRRVTLDGDVVDASNLMTGGSINKKNAGGAFQGNDEEKLPALEAELEALRRKERQLESDIRSAQEEIAEYFSRKIDMEKESGRTREQIAKLEARLEDIQASIDKAKERISIVKETINELVSRREELLSTIASEEVHLQSIEDDLRVLEGRMENSAHSTLKQEIAKLEGEIKKLEKELGSKQVLLAQRETRLNDHVNNDLAGIDAKVNELEILAASRLEEMNERETRLKTLQGEMKELETTIASKNAELSALINERKKWVSRKDMLTREIQELVLNHQSNEMKCSTARTRLHELETSLGHLKKSLPVDLDVPGEYLDRTVQELATDIEATRKEIESMGNVNMMAIEKYDEYKERFDDLNMRHGILIKERESILEFMDTIEKQKKTAFIQTFQSIARNFAYIFSRLSPGGEGKLELENLEDPFAGGVLIMARPAGKPLNEISLLSGGEKSLTSLSLIFAIQQHQPSPLYVLDEIDAALDDDNATRVAELIKELSNRSQFIIITHRDVTMTRVDQILGVSNVDGCTDVMSLDLKQISSILSEE